MWTLEIGHHKIWEIWNTFYTFSQKGVVKIWWVVAEEKLEY